MAKREHKKNAVLVTRVPCPLPCTAGIVPAVKERRSRRSYSRRDGGGTVARASCPHPSGRDDRSALHECGILYAGPLRGVFRTSMLPGLLGLLGLLLLSGPWAWADLVTLRDGTVREGRIVKQDGSGLTLEIRLGGMRARVRIERKEIVSIERKALPPDPVEVQAAKLRAAARTQKGAGAAEAWVKLGDFYAERLGYSSQAKAAYRKALEADPNHAGAHRRLGHVKTERGWQKVDAERRARGLVPLGEVWVRPAERAWLIDQRHQKESEELRIGPRKQDDPFTRAQIEKALALKRAEEEYRQRERLRLDYGYSLLSRYGYYAPYGSGAYIGSGYTPYYADGVGLSYGNNSFFVGRVGSGYGYGGSGYGYGGLGYGSGLGLSFGHGGGFSGHGTVGAINNFRHNFGFSPGIVHSSGNHSFAFGTNLSNFGGYGGYGGYGSYGYGGGYGIHLSGGSKHFRYGINIGGFSSRSSFGSSTGFGF